jgi:hypothetical protein
MGVTGAGLMNPNSDAMSSGNTPEKRMEKKLLKAEEIRDKTTSATQDNNHSVLRTHANIHLKQISPHLSPVNKGYVYGDQKENKFKAIIFGLGSEIEANRPQQNAEDDARIQASRTRIWAEQEKGQKSQTGYRNRSQRSAPFGR